jgi:hypothetical protein
MPEHTKQLLQLIPDFHLFHARVRLPLFVDNEITFSYSIMAKGSTFNICDDQKVPSGMVGRLIGVTIDARIDETDAVCIYSILFKVIPESHHDAEIFRVIGRKFLASDFLEPPTAHLTLNEEATNNA